MRSAGWPVAGLLNLTDTDTPGTRRRRVYFPSFLSKNLFRELNCPRSYPTVDACNSASLSAVLRATKERNLNFSF